MSIKETDQRIEAIRAEADRQRSSYIEHRRFIQDSPNLTQAGRDAELGPLEESFRDNMRALREQETGVVAAAVQALQRRVYGTVGTSPDAVIMFRDAQERAGRLEGIDEAQEAMQRAIQSKDAGLGQAILGRALEQGWRSVIELYTSENAAVAEAVNDLATLTRFQTDSTQRLRASMHYM